MATPQPPTNNGNANKSTADRWLHCNSCFMVPETGPINHYYFVTCGHIFCKSCCAKGSNLAKARTCLLCKKQEVQYMEINRNIQSKFRNLFRSVRDVAQECMTEMQRVIEFQQRHKGSLMRHFTEKNQKAVTYAKTVHSEFEKQKTKEQQYAKERGDLLKHVERLRQENELLKNQMEQMRRQIHPIPHQQDYITAAPDSGLGTNDSMSMSFIETVTSTPIMEQGQNTRRHLAAAFQTSTGSAPSPISMHNHLLTTPAMLGLPKTPNGFIARDLAVPRPATIYTLPNSRRASNEERRVLTDRRPNYKNFPSTSRSNNNSNEYIGFT